MLQVLNYRCSKKPSQTAPKEWVWLCASNFTKTSGKLGGPWAIKQTAELPLHNTSKGHLAGLCRSLPLVQATWGDMVLSGQGGSISSGHLSEWGKRDGRCCDPLGIFPSEMVWWPGKKKLGVTVQCLL